MALERYRAVNFKPDSLVRIDECNAIISSYQAQGLTLSLRQLYYQLVSANLITNEERSYKQLSSLVSDARLAGRMDWDAIEDRVRRPYAASEWDSIGDLVDGALRAFRLPRWAGQENYVELWVEKDALANVLQPIAHEFHITLMVNRGYSSQSAMYESAARFLEACRAPEAPDDPDYRLDDQNEMECETCYGSGQCQKCDGAGTRGRKEEKECLECGGDGECHAAGCRDGFTRAFVRRPVLLYLGDLDPSGEDMVRDIKERLEMFGVHDLDIRKLALTPAQVRQYNPPPNPAKVTDPRAAEYIRQHGTRSWEVDALPPNILAQIIRAELATVCDVKAMEVVKKREEVEKKKLRDAAAKIGGGK